MFSLPYEVNIIIPAFIFMCIFYLFIHIIPVCTLSCFCVCCRGLKVSRLLFMWLSFLVILDFQSSTIKVAHAE